MKRAFLLAALALVPGLSRAAPADQDPNAKDKNGWTPLMWAAYNGSTTAFQSLLDRGASTSASAFDAASAGDMAALKSLAATKSAANAKTSDGTPVLLFAASAGRLDAARYLLDLGADPRSEDKHYTALSKAAYNHHVDVTRLLLEKGARPDPKEKVGMSALWGAAQDGDVAVAKALLDHGADIHWEWGKDDTPLAVAILAGRGEMVELLLSRGALPNLNDDAGTKMFLKAVDSRSLGVVEAFLRHGANPNAVPSLGEGALCIAVGRERPDIVKLLLDHGADAKSGRSCSSFTLLRSAIYYKPVETVALLLDHGADPNGYQPMATHPQSMLQAALDADASALDKSRLLLEHGADPNRGAIGEDVPLFGVVFYSSSKFQESDRLAMVKLLVEHGADVNIKRFDQGKVDDTILIVAAREGYPAIVRYLIERGADVNAKGGYDYTPLRAAGSRGWLDIIRLLIDSGAEWGKPLEDSDVCWNAPKQPCPKEEIMRLVAEAEKAAPQRRMTARLLAGFNETPDLAAGRLVWQKGAAPAEGLELDPAASPWINVQNLASRLLKYDLERSVGKPRPAAPKLSQGEYEPAAAFKARVSSAKKDYEDAVAAYDAAAAAYPAWRRNAVVQAALAAVLGSPKVAAGRDYDPESQAFAPQVVSDSPYAKSFQQAFVLSETIPYERAQAFDQALQASSPRVVFELRGSKLVVASAEFDVQGRTCQAVPLGAAAGQAQPLAKVDLGEGRPAPAAAVSVQYADNPQVAAKLAELEKLKRENAAKSELKALEAQIAELKRGQAKSYASDVDEPAFPARPARPDDLALVIGIESYQDAHLPKADYAERDAEAVAAHLRRLGVSADNITKLTGDAATAGRIKGYLESWLPKNAKPGSRVYFYFSGHGAPDPASHDAYLLSWDGDPRLLKTTAVSLAEVYSDLGKLPAKEILVAMDSCFSGASGRSVLKKGARPLVSVRTDEGLSSNITVMAAAQNDEIANSLDKQGHGMFTYYFLKGVGRGAGRGSLDTRGLCEFVKAEVKGAAARDSGAQTPVCKGPDIPLW